MPSVQSAADGWKKLYPDMTAFIDSADFAQNVVNAKGAGDVITDFNAQLDTLKTVRPEDDPRLGPDEPAGRPRPERA